MKSIKEILQGHGIAVPEESAEAFAKEFAENYRTIAEMEQKAAKIAQLEGDNANLAAELEKVKGVDATNAAQVEELKASIAEMQKAEEERRAAAELEDAKAAFGKEFETALGGKEFANGIVADSVRAKAFEKAQANPDMPVADIIAAVVPDEEGIWRNPQREPFKQSAPGQGDPVGSLDALKGKDSAYINEHWAEIQAMLAR